MQIAQGQKPGIVFVARFFAVLIAFYAVIALGPVNDHLIVPFTEFVVASAAVTLHWIHEPIEVVGTEIRTPNFGLEVRNGCNGVEAMMLLAAAMLAFPATFRSRLAGLFITSLAIQILNLIRVGSLVWLGEHHRAAFDIVHVGVWQTVVILAAVSMFVVWSVRFAEKPLQTRS
jgi:exosortase H (IPTLxxWG-CTERM-specific)